jgi:hypothetical protein
LLTYRGLTLENTFPPEVCETKVSHGWRIRRQGRFKGPGDAVVVGPNIYKTTLEIDKDEARLWIQKNRHHIAARRGSWSRRRWPVLLVVLEEWRCDTWTHIPYSQSTGTTTVGLISSGEGNAPQWRYFGFEDKTMSLTNMIGNSPVSPVLRIVSDLGLQASRGSSRWYFVFGFRKEFTCCTVFLLHDNFVAESVVEKGKHGKGKHRVEGGRKVSHTGVGI